MFCPTSDDSNDTIHNGYDEDQMETIAKLLQNTNVTGDERRLVDFTVHEKLTLSTKEERDSLMKLESNISRIEPSISASVEGNIPETNKNLLKKLKEVYQSQEETPEINVTHFHVTIKKLIESKGSRCKYVTDSSICCKTPEFDRDTQGSALLLQLGIGTQVNFYVQEEAARLPPLI